MRIKSKLKELMDAEELSQKAVVAETGLSPMTVGKIYNGHFTRIDSNTIMVLCRRFQLSEIGQLLEIVWETDDEPNQ